MKKKRFLLSFILLTAALCSYFLLQPGKPVQVHPEKALCRAVLFRDTARIAPGTAGSDIYRIQGFDPWEQTGLQFARSIAPLTRIRFYRTRKSDVRIRIRCRISPVSFHTEAANPVQLRLSMNRKKIDSVRIARSWREISCDIPKEYISCGVNILTLETIPPTLNAFVPYDLEWIKISPGPEKSGLPVLKTSEDGWWKPAPGQGLEVRGITQRNAPVWIETAGNPQGYLTGSIRCDDGRRADFKVGRYFLIPKRVFILPGTGSGDADEETGISVFIANLHSDSPIRVRVSTGKYHKLPDHVFPSTPARPNVIILTLDAMRADAMGCYGYPKPTTPGIDCLARNSLQLAESIAAAPYTTSSVASLMTGRNAMYHGVYHIGDPIPGHLRTLAEHFTLSGYQTYGVTAMMSIDGDFGFSRGFIRYREVYTPGNSIVDGEKSVTAVQELLSSITPEKPLFLYVHIREPHEPYNMPEPYGDIFGNGEKWKYLNKPETLSRLHSTKITPTSLQIKGLRLLYNANLRYGDNCLTRVLHSLRASPFWDNAVVAVIADHGEAFGEHGYLFHNKSVYQEMVRIPILFTGGALPGSLQGKLAGASGTVELSRYLASLSGFESDFPRPAASPTEPRFISQGIGRGGPVALFTGQWKFISRARKFAVHQLFRLDSDPGEREDLRDAFPEICRMFQNELDFQEMLKPLKQRRAALSNQQKTQLKALGYLN